MTGFKPKSDNYGVRVRESFAKQGLMSTLGAQICNVEPGIVEIEMPYDASL